MITRYAETNAEPTCRPARRVIDSIDEHVIINTSYVLHAVLNDIFELNLKLERRAGITEIANQPNSSGAEKVSNRLQGFVTTVSFAALAP